MRHMELANLRIPGCFFTVPNTVIYPYYTLCYRIPMKRLKAMKTSREGHNTC